MYFRIVTVCILLALANGFSFGTYNHVNQEKDLLKRILKVLQERQTTDITGIVDTLAPDLDIPLTELAEVTESQRAALVDFTKTALNTVLTDLGATDYTDCVIAVHTTGFLKRHVKPLLNRMQNTVLSAVTSEVLTEEEDIKILKDVRKLVPKFMKEVSESVKAEAKEIKDQIDTIIGAEVELEIAEGPHPTPVAGTDGSPKTTKDLLTRFLTKTVAVVEQLKTLIPTDASTKCPQVVDAIVTAIENRSPPDVATIITGLTASVEEKKILTDAVQNLQDTLNTFEKIKVFEKIKAELEVSTGLEKLDFVIGQHMTNLESVRGALNLLETLTSGTALKDLTAVELEDVVDRLLQLRETPENVDCISIKYMGIVKGLLILDRLQMTADNPLLNDAVKGVLKTIKDVDTTALLGDNKTPQTSVSALVLALSRYYKEKLLALPDIDKSAELLPFNLIYTGLKDSKKDILPEESESGESESSKSGEKPDKRKLALTMAATMEQGLRLTTDACPTVDTKETEFLNAVLGLKAVPSAEDITDFIVKVIENLCTAADVSCPDLMGIEATDLYKELITPVDTLLTELAVLFETQQTWREIVKENLGEIFYAVLHPQELKKLGLLAPSKPKGRN